jgi:hypothetical protein
VAVDIRDVLESGVAIVVIMVMMLLLALWPACPESIATAARTLHPEIR